MASMTPWLITGEARRGWVTGPLLRALGKSRWSSADADRRGPLDETIEPMPTVAGTVADARGDMCG